jgi:hypothetical protein
VTSHVRATRLPRAARGAALLVTALSLTAVPAGNAAAAVRAPAARPAPAASATPGPPVFAHYYLWWSTLHWQDKLGADYPYAASPPPLPATTDADGCGAVTRYAGNQLTDVPLARLESQDTPGVIEKDVRQAAAAGLAGFNVNWIGTGLAGQTSDSISYSRRLAALVDAVHRVNREGIPFRVAFGLKASASRRTDGQLVNDIDYLVRTYGGDSAVDHSWSGSRLPIVWNGSRTYSDASLAAVSRAVRSRAAVLGDEISSSWSGARAASLDGNAYYWSSQDPVRNPQSFAQLRTLAATVKGSAPNPDGSPKVWLAPLNPGFSARLLTGSATCVPRRGGQTLVDLFHGNATSDPDGFLLISWNEIAEGTHIKPMRRYGYRYTNTVRELVDGTA